MISSAVASRQSSIHDELEHLSPTWVTIGGMPAVAHFGDADGERRQAKALGLCELSAPRKLGVKGAGAAAWFGNNGIIVPDSIYAHSSLGADGVIMRTGATEFFVQDEPEGQTVDRLLAPPSSSLPEGVYRYDRQDAGLLLVGMNAFNVLAETCGYDFRHPEHDLVFTRVAGVSCMILRKDREPRVPLFRLWCDASYGAYLWEQLLEITRGAGGGPVGTQALT